MIITYIYNRIYSRLTSSIMSSRFIECKNDAPITYWQKKNDCHISPSMTSWQINELPSCWIIGKNLTFALFDVGLLIAIDYSPGQRRTRVFSFCDVCISIILCEDIITSTLLWIQTGCSQVSMKGWFPLNILDLSLRLGHQITRYDIVADRP